MAPLVREQVQEVEQRLRDLGPLTGPELRALVGVLAETATPGGFALAVLSVLPADGETVTSVAVAGDGRGPEDAPAVEGQEPAPVLVVEGVRGP